MIRRTSVVLGMLLVAAAGYVVVSAGPTLREPTSAELGTWLMLRVTVGERQPAEVKVQSGGQAFLTLPDGTDVVLEPLLGDGQVDLAIRQKGRAEEFETQTFVLRAHEPATRVLGEVLVEWLGMGTTRPTGLAPNGPCRTCCITCEGLTVCGCEVVHTCGHCCCSGTCTCQGETEK